MEIIIQKAKGVRNEINKLPSANNNNYNNSNNSDNDNRNNNNSGTTFLFSTRITLHCNGGLRPNHNNR